MGRLIHPSGNLTMKIHNIEVDSEDLCISGTMGVWDAKILLSPEEVGSLIRFMFRPQLIKYMFLVLWRLLHRNRSHE